ncbi:MAG: glycosyltransferase family 1 protein [Rhodospirillales bacterium]|nr:glycosyltransferase family 1 protein [Rhodospirillales bacterium]
MTKAVLFTGAVLHGNVARLLGGLARGLAAHGVEPVWIDSADPGHSAELRRLGEDEDALFFLGMTGLGLDLRSEDNVFNRIGRPLVSVYLDPLVGYTDQVLVPIRRRIVTTVSDCDLDYWRAAAPGIDIRHLPHAAEPARGRPWTEREIPLLFSATGCEDPERTRENWSRHGEKTAAELNAVLEIHLRAPLRPLTVAIAQALGRRLDVGNPYAIHPYFVTVEVYLRRRARWRLLEALKGLPVTVVGGGWEAFAACHPDHGFAFLGPRAADEVQDMMTRAKIALNACTGFHGTHERVFDAQAAGAAAATTPTGWFRAHAPQDAMVLIEEDGAGETVRRLLARDRDAKRIAARGRAWQARHHTWAHRARDILAWVGQI